MLTQPDRATADPGAHAGLERALDTVTVARPAAVHVLGLIEDPNTTAARLSSAVELDPALTAHIMRLANSAFYGLSGRVGNTGFAVTVIGFSAVRSLAAVSAAGLDDGEATTPPEFWRHAATVAAAAAVLAPTFDIPNGDAFAGGLLHDVGTALLHRYDPAAHTALMDTWGTDSLALRDAEAVTLGLSHDHAAARLLASWNFPTAMVDAIARHHEPPQSRSPYGRMLTAADALAHVLDGQPGSSEHLETLWSAGVAEDQVEYLVETVAQKAAEIYASLPVS